jgi:hypothetical protein
MKNFFTVIIIIAVSILILLTYYAAKNVYFRYNRKRIKSEIEKKRYEDEKRYLYFYIRSLLKDLKAGRLQWILIFSRIYPDAKIEVIYNSMKDMMQIQHRIRNVSDRELFDLRRLGMHSCETGNDLSCFHVSNNSKIVTDIVYFFLEQLGQQIRAHNIKVITSGG